MNSNATLVYTNHDPIIVSEPIHTIFTLLAKVQNNSSNDLDGKWLKFEHEGKLGSARFLLADSSKAWNGEDWHRDNWDSLRRETNNRLPQMVRVVVFFGNILASLYKYIRTVRVLEYYEYYVDY